MTPEASLLQAQKTLQELAKNTMKQANNLRHGILAEIEETRGCNND